MRVGYVLRYWPTLSETFVVREIRALQDLGIEVEVIGLGTRREACAGEPVRVPVHRPPRGTGALALLPPVARHPTALGPLVHHRPKDALRIVWLADLVRTRGYDRLHAHFAGEAAVWARGAAAIAGVPYSVTVHAVDLFRPRPDLDAILGDADPTVTICEHHRRWLWQRHGIDAVVVPSGVDPAAYPLADPVHGPIPWVSVARDVPKKGLDDLVWAVRRVGGGLRLVSDGVRFGGPGVLAGPLPATRVPGILARGRVFVLPCRIAPDGDRDGLPVAILEAMAAGLPVVSTPVAGIGEIVDAEVGWLVPPGDRVALARCLDEIRSDPTARRQRGLAARARIVSQGWTLARQARNLLGCWSGSVAR